MEFVKNGDLILQEAPDAAGEAKLVSTLLRIYRSATPDQLESLLAKPKPLVIIRGIREENARKLVDVFRAHGVNLDFIPSGGAAIPPDQPAVQAAGWDTIAQEPAAGPGTPPAAREAVAPARPRRYLLSFTGSAGEYFRIWIVNIVLTILTLGIYGAWAKVRTRRYFYANTKLDGLPFDYLAKPSAILKGYLIVGGALLLMNITNNLSFFIGSVVSAVGWSLVPFLLYKAHRFKAKNSAYRNIRFHFTGNIMEAYKAYAFIPGFVVVGLVITLLAPVGAATGPDEIPAVSFLFPVLMFLFMLLFLAALPYFFYLQKRYFHGNMSFGKTASAFDGRAKTYYGIYAIAFAMGVGVMFIGGIFIAISGGFAALLARGGGEVSTIGIFGMMLFIFALIGIPMLLIQQYIYAAIFNYSWGSSQLGPISFDADLKAKDLAWIRFSNVAAIVLSLGFLAPWAKVRRARYMLPRTEVTLPADMDAFEADIIYKEGAVGDTAADFFDWDIGW